MHKGFEIKRAPYRPAAFCAEARATAIYHDGELQAFVASDEGFAEHVIDVKLKEGAWPKNSGKGKPAADCGDSPQIAADCRKARRSKV
jgi:hypothetical protein